MKFSSVGVLNTLIDFGGFSFFLWILGFNKFYAQVLSFSLAVLNSYILNKFWTFNSVKCTSKTAFLKMYVVNAIALLITLGALKLFSDVFGMHAIIAKIIATPPVMVLNFLATKYLVFCDAKK